MSDSNRLAAIDMGTNSFHLIVVEAKPNGKFTTLGREKEVVRLGESMTDMKHMSLDAMLRALEALKRFKLIADSFHAPIRAVATSAVREALNKEAFVELVREGTGLEIEVVSGFEEARLIYLGVLQALPVFNKNALLFDIGGGSTEFLLGKQGKVQYANSLKLGAIRLTKRYFQSKSTKDKEIEDCREFLRGALHPVKLVLAEKKCDVVVGSSGTMLSIAAIALGLEGVVYSVDEGNVTVSRAQAMDVVKRILDARTLEKRKQIPGMDPQRADIIVAGALIVEQIFESLDLQEVVTSKYALREGVILDTIHKLTGTTDATRRHLADIRRASVLHIGQNCRFEEDHAETVTRLSTQIFDQTVDLHQLGSEEREYLEAASMLHDIGYHISHAQHHRHSYYLIRHSELLGFTDREIEIIANVARSHSKSQPKQKHEAYAVLSERDRLIVRRLSAILRIADGLDRRHTDSVQSIAVKRRKNDIDMLIETAEGEDISLEIWGAERREQLFEEEFSVRVNLIAPVALASGGKG